MSIGSSSLLESGAVALATIATLFLTRDIIGLSRGRNGRGRNAESAIKRKEHQFDAIVNAELVINVREMVLDRVLADAKRRCNVSVGLAIDESPDNLHFPACYTQTSDFRFRSRRGINLRCRRTCCN